MISGPSLAPAAPRRPLLGGLHPAVRVLGGLLAVLTPFCLPPSAVPPAALFTAVLAAASGLELRRQLRALARWWPVALLVLAVHTLTTTAAAPLGRPSWPGLAAGTVALLRLATSAGALAVLMRSTDLDELAGGLRWWGAPLRRGGAADDLGLVLAVALGTAPALLGEARRVEAVAELRRHGPGGAPRRGALTRVRDRAAVLLPLLDALGRRAEALTLSLRRRRPLAVACPRPPLVQLVALAAWSAALIALVVLRAPRAGW